MGKNAAAKEAKRARKAEEARQERIRQGVESIDNTFGDSFNDQFFSDLQQSFVDYARPQLDDQVGDAREQSTYALARNGTLDSTIRTKQFGDIQREYDTQLQNITDQALQQSTDARTGVERARSDLVTMLQATGDADAAAKGALSQAAILSAAPAYSPLEQLFTDFTAGLAQQAALERAEALGYGVTPRYHTGLFGSSSGAVKTT